MTALEFGGWRTAKVGGWSTEKRSKRKRSQDIAAGVPGSNSLVAIQESDFEVILIQLWVWVKMVLERLGA